MDALLTEVEGCIKKLKTTKLPRVDATAETGEKVTAYWCGSVLRIDVKGVAREGH